MALDGHPHRRSLQARGKRRPQLKMKPRTTKRQPRRVLMKRRRIVNLETCRRSTYAIARRVDTLKRLIPNTDQSKGLDGLFRDAADYILNLETRVKIMQILLNAFSERDMPISCDSTVM